MPASDQKATQKNLPGIFISYRRSDNPDATGRIYDRLVSEFGKARVFKDVDSIPLGQDFRGHLNEVMGGCAAVLAIIGPRWTDARNDAGQRRLENPDDFVRIELEAALARRVPVVPVLVGHAPMPGSGQLPESLISLIYRQAIEVRPDPDFHNDATRLVSALRLILDPNARVGTPAGQPLKWMVAFAAGAIIAAAALAVPALKYLRQSPPPETRVDIVTPATDQANDFALSPDGRQIAFVAKGDGKQRLWVRSLGEATAQPLSGTEGASGPFWSPDSHSIAFFSPGGLKRLDVGGGQPQTLAGVGGDVGDGSWGADGTILSARGPADPLVRVASTGGELSVVTKTSSQSGAHRAPFFLPDGQRFLYLSLAGTSTGIYLGALNGRQPVRLSPDLGLVAYVPSGWMLWLRGDALVAQRLDLEKAVLTGQRLTLAEGVARFSVSTTGLIAYRNGAARQLQLTWVDRSGAVRGMIGDPDETLRAPRVSPDGHRVMVSRRAQGNADIWLLDGARASRMTFDAAADGFPIWSPDGTRIVFTSTRLGGADLYQKLASGEGTDQLLLQSDQIKYPSSWSADGRFLMYFSVDAHTGTDIWVLPMTGDRKPFPFLRTPAGEVWAQFSPDGRWVAYASNASGRDEVYVRPFASPGAGEKAGSDAATGQWQVSTGGGVFPVWRPDGKELYYINPAGEMMSAPFTITGSAFEPGAPTKLFQTHVAEGGVDHTQGRQYDIAPDGRFLINTELPESSATPPITLLQNWNPDARK